MNRRLSRPLAVLVGLALVPLVGLVSAAPASANTLDSFTLSKTSLKPGATVTATATWTATDSGNRDLSISIPAGLTASWTSASTVPARTCVTDAPPTDAACLWNLHVSGDTITLTAVLTVAANATPGTYDLTASASVADTNGPLTAPLTVLSDATPAISVTPSSATPGSVATATGNFTALTTGDIRVAVFLTGTSGNGTFGTATATTGLSGCVLNVSARAFDCLWSGAVVGQTRSIVIPVNVGSGATAGQSWNLQACSNAQTAAIACATTALAIVAVAVTPTPTASPTVSPSPTTSAPAVPTAVPAGEGPLGGADGNGNGFPLPWLVMVPMLATALAIVALVAARRSGQHSV